jgi:hypothetical protein
VTGAIDTLADTAGEFASFSSWPATNAAGEVAFRANLDGGGQGLYVSDGATLTTIAATAGSFSAISDYFSINGSGVVAFRASPDTGGIGIYIGDGGTPNEVVPPESFEFSYVEVPAIADDGTVVFYATRLGGPSGLYTGTNLATDAVIEVGDALFGSTVISLDVGGTYQHGVSPSGRVGFSYALASGMSGVAVATPVPEPSGAAALLSALASLITRASRRPRRRDRGADGSDRHSHPSTAPIPARRICSTTGTRRSGRLPREGSRT